MNYGEMVIINDSKPDSSSLYAPVYNNNAMIDLFGITPGLYKEVLKEDASTVKTRNNKHTLTRRSVTLVFNPAQLPIEERVKQLLVYWIELFTKAVPVKANDSIINANKSIVFKFSDIAKEFGVSYRQAKVMSIEAAEALQGTIIKWEENDCLLSFNILQDYMTRKSNRDIERGCMCITFADKFAHALPQMSILWFPREVRKISVRHFPNAGIFAMLLSAHYNRNFKKIGKDGICSISVKTLLDSTSEIPKYEKVMQTNRMVFKRIIAPFIRDMNVLVDNKTLEHWNLAYKKDYIDKSTYSDLKYNVFIDCIVHFKFAYYPVDKQVKKLH